jgi:hypothetical protein
MPDRRPSSHDISFKEMLARNFLAFLRWLLPDVEATQILKLPEELPATARRVDLITRVKLKPRGSRAREVIVIFECQVQRDPALPRTMLLRAVLAHSVYRRAVRTIVLALSPAAVVPTDYIYGEGPDGETLCHRVTVRRIFEESADDALGSDINELLPLVTTMRPGNSDRAALLHRVVARILARIPDAEGRTMMLEQTRNFAALHLSRSAIDGIVRDASRRHGMLDPLRDFPYIRDSYRKGLRKGNAKGKAESVLSILEARGIRLTKAARAKILSCSDAELLDRWVRSAVSAASAAEVLQTH